MTKKVLIPLPAYDFDPTEVAVPFLALQQHEIVFATPQGQRPQVDPVMLTGKGLGLLAPLLMADTHGRTAFTQLEQAAPYQQPLSWEQIRTEDYDALLLPGGHAPGMRTYLESDKLQQVVSQFMQANKPVAAICHGMVLLARSRSANSVQSVLSGRHVCALPKLSELLAWNLTRAWMGNYYRTYPQLTVEEEVRSAVGASGKVETGPLTLVRDSPDKFNCGFTIRDGNLLTARWPGDAHKFAAEFCQMIEAL